MSLLNLYHSHCCHLVSLQLTCIFLQNPSWPQDTYWRHNLTQKSYCYNCYLMSIHTCICLFNNHFFSFLFFLWRLILNPSLFLEICCLPFCFLCSSLFLQKGRNLRFFFSLLNCILLFQTISPIYQHCCNCNPVFSNTYCPTGELNTCFLHPVLQITNRNIA